MCNWRQMTAASHSSGLEFLNTSRLQLVCFLFEAQKTLYRLYQFSFLVAVEMVKKIVNSTHV
jgi:hypothetical protein